MRDIKTGTKTNMKFRSDETAELLRVDEKELQYLFHEGDQYTFMDQESYEQVTVQRDLIGDAADFLVDNMMVTMDFLEGGGAVAVHLPSTSVHTVVEADAVVKGQTASSSYKPAVVEGGIRVMVPPHIAVGTRLVINTEDGSYMERAKD